jgi:hypothetical protein
MPSKNSEAMNLIRAFAESQKCVKNKCLKEEAQYKKLNKIYQEKKAKYQQLYKAKKMTKQELKRKIRNVNIALYKSKQHYDLIKCKLAKCHQQTKNLALAALDTFIKAYDKTNPIHVLSQKYKAIFSQNITPQLLRDFDIKYQRVKYR